MSLWRHLRRGMRVLTNRAAADRDLADEVAHYAEQRTAELIARGVAPDDARRLASLEIGNATVAREQVRSYGWENVLSATIADVRYALRRLRAAPAFTTVVLVTLALGIGATTAIFSAVNRVLFESLPYPHADRIATIVEVGANGARNAGTYGMYRTLSERSRSFETMAVVRTWQPTLIGTGAAERLRGERVSASYFRLLGVHPAQGRDLLASEDVPRAARVVVISDRLWRRHFDANPAIIGSVIDLDDDPYRVVGVMPPNFENALDPAADVWSALQYDLTLGQAWGHHLRTVGRLRGGVSIEQAGREIDALGQSVLREQRPETYDPNTRFIVAGLHDELTRGVRPTLLAILAGVMLVLVIACVNVANLLLVRGVQRRGEFALRVALGAGTGRIVRQLLIESLVLALLGGAGGAVVATFGVRVLATLGGAQLPRTADVGVDRSMFLFTFCITLLVGVVLGLIPAIQAVRNDRGRDIQPGSHRSTVRHGAGRSALVVVEIALALVLLVTSGLLLRSLQRLFAVQPGFEPAHVMTLQVQATGHRFDRDSVTHDFFTQMLSAVRRVPGVTSAGLTSQLPLSGDLDEYGASFPASDARSSAGYSSYRYAVSPGYLETMGIRLVRGRVFDEQDRADAPRVALISESLARARFGESSPLGREVTIGGGAGTQPFRIVGVVGDVRQVSLALGRSEAVYTTAAQWRWADRAMSLVVRTRDDPDALVAAIRQAIWSVDKTQPIVRVAAMSDLITASAAERRFALTLFEAFALAALVLAAAGIYGVLAGSVVERTREIGIRTALGATRGGILALIARQGMALAGVGMIIGLAASFIASRMIGALLFGVSSLDPVTYASVLILLFLVSALACWIPARRAAGVDPALTLRNE